MRDNNVLARNLQPDQEVKTYMELPDGSVFSGKVIMTSVNVYENFPGVVQWNMELEGIGAAEWIRGVDVARDVLRRLAPQEWECEYCGRANYIKLQQCQGCGWYRGVLIDTVQEAGVWRFRQ